MINDFQRMYGTRRLRKLMASRGVSAKSKAIQLRKTQFRLKEREYYLKMRFETNYFDG